MYYTIGQVAKMHHLTISQIHYYDRQGLFPFLQRNEKRDRVFNEEALKYLEMILCLKETGMPIQKIKQFIDWSMDGESTILQRLELMKQQKINVLQHIKDTEKNLKKIQQKITKYEHEITSIAQNTK
ncbi:MULTISPECIES: MerR family transcriptional regulator [Bacillus cereus group]|uniref:MerR family transcriptional regulator n=1 Tax=Bacillus cereus group TaxID=86661 RepID=UPI000BEC6ED5|nr:MULTISPECIES: MerR family transcriptional regulator [Bacillus cereus group]MBJ8097545.1 MerR family transcriptional regulator [Bacillus cereus group sp. N11]MDF9450422.1 MerR family transcriptional regulator [Bacillus toyonensis]MDG1564332.1 MerR family transcriptional regulator [Bacillus toyonensis]PDY94115.1 MerR family transcriptional regulator [Bacillus toyonensis]PGE69561.1 MerR family transcriptional regulator [Bacillus toyonensis]